jgi:hypothetical protein
MDGEPTCRYPQLSQEEFATPINDLPVFQDVTEKVRRARLLQVPGRIGPDLNTRIHGERHFDQQIHELSMTHPGKIRGNHGQVHVAPVICIPARMRPEEDGLVDADILQ